VLPDAFCCVDLRFDGTTFSGADLELLFPVSIQEIAIFLVILFPGYPIPSKVFYSRNNLGLKSWVPGDLNSDKNSRPEVLTIESSSARQQGVAGVFVCLFL
jgi:hypothetical protein